MRKIFVLLLAFFALLFSGSAFAQLAPISLDTDDELEVQLPDNLIPGSELFVQEEEPNTEIFAEETPSEEEPPTEAQPELINEPGSPEDQKQEALDAIKESLIERYKSVVDGIVERLKEKIADEPVDVQKNILSKMQEKVQIKRDEIAGNGNIGDLRRDTLIEILDYIVGQLTYVPEPEILPSGDVFEDQAFFFYRF